MAVTRLGLYGGPRAPYAGFAPAAASAAITGTLSGGVAETLIQGTGGTIIITVTNDTWVAAGATFNAQRQNIIDGLDAAASPTNGWNNEIRDVIDVSTVVRTSDTVVTITVPATATYDIDATETITVTVPATALVTASADVTATPTLTVTEVVSTVGGTSNYRKKREDPESLREAARLALLRRRKKELLESERLRAQQAKTPQNAQETVTRLFKIDQELEQIHNEIIEYETEVATRKAKRRKRDKTAIMLLIN